METQISALVSKSTRDLLDRHSRRTGIKKSRLIEDAIRHHLATFEQFPEEFVIPTRLVISSEEFKKLESSARGGKPKTALQALMRSR